MRAHQAGHVIDYLPEPRRKSPALYAYCVMRSTESAASKSSFAQFSRLPDCFVTNVIFAYLAVNNGRDIILAPKSGVVHLHVLKT